MGDNLRIDRVKFAAALARKDVSVKRLSEIAGVSRVTVSSVKCGKTCSEETASKLARALGIDVQEIIALEKAG